MKPNSSSLALRLSAVREEIARSCSACGRAPGEVLLVAVSKGQPFEAIMQAYELGMRDFGESYALEFSHKLAQAKLNNISDIRWHYLGALQSNKLKIIVQAQVIHSVDSLRHAELLGQAAHQKLAVYLQVKLSDEPGRQGFVPEDVPKALDACAGLAKLDVRGLMTIVPLRPAIAAGHWFGCMRELRNKLGRPELQLSMGMSGDFSEAIRYGADVIRVGTSIFGPRG